MARASLFRRILVPYDFSAPSDRALIVAADLAKHHGGRVTALHVLTPLYSGLGYPAQAEIAWTPPAQLVEEQRRHLERTVRETLGKKASDVVCLAAMGDAASEILAACRNADVVVMATLGRTGLGHLLIGSIAEKIVRHSPVPVLTIRAAPPRRRRQKRRA